MKRTCAHIIVFMLAGISAGNQREAEQARIVELTLHPAKAPEPVQRYQLLPKAEDQNDAEAPPLYEKAVQSLPKNLQWNQISQWLKSPLDKLPRKEVRLNLQQQMEPTVLGY